MDDGYASLARAIRRPMRRWWLRIGVWWLAATLIAFCAAIWYIVKIEIPPAFSSSWRGVAVLDRQGFWLAVNPVFVAMATSTWLLYVLKARFLVTSLVKDSASVPLRKLRFWIFRLAITSGVLTWVAIAGMELLQALVREHYIVGGSHFALRSLPIVVVILWIAALLSLDISGRAVGVLWHLAFNVLPAVGWLLTAILERQLYWILGTSKGIAIESLAAESLLFFLMLVLAYGVLFLLARGYQTWAIALAAIVAASMLVNSLYAWTGIPLIDTMAYCLGWMVYMAPLQPIRIYLEDSTILTWVVGIRLDIPCSMVLEPVVSNARFAYLVLHFLAIRWILQQAPPQREI